MSSTQYAILRFAKYKGPEISRIEAHNERTKERYKSNPDVDVIRSKFNFHLINPKRRYRAEAERQIAATKCRVRSDSVRMVEALVTASPAFFENKTRAEISDFFCSALEFLLERQSLSTMMSAVVHMDEKTPHMHLTFVPITEDGRLSAKDIVGNRKKLTKWQDDFWQHMVREYPDLERGESAGRTGRDHIPPRVFKEMDHLLEERKQLDKLLAGVNFLNVKTKTREITTFLNAYMPRLSHMATKLKKYGAEFDTLTQERAELEFENQNLLRQLENTHRTSLEKKMKGAQLERDYQSMLELLEKLSPEVLCYRAEADAAYKSKEIGRK